MDGLFSIDAGTKQREGIQKSAKTRMGWTDQISLQGALNGKDNISNAARARAGVVVATRPRHEFSMVYVR